MTQVSSKRYVLLRYHEVGLKGKNRPYFIKHLVRNVQRVTRGLGVQRVWPGHGMIGVALTDEADWDTVRAALGTVYGVVKMSLAHRVPRDLEKIKEAIGEAIQDRSFKSFRITTSRADKQFPISSTEINVQLGSYVQELTGAKVTLKNPEETIYVDIMPREAYYYFDPLPGAGGLPVGTGGQVAALLSGGIDSPIAAQRMMRRGCRVSFVHFHAFPLVDGSSRDKAIELVELLDKYQGRSRLYLVPFAEVQKRIIVNVPPAYRVVLYRRFMVRIAERLAEREKAYALVTGESLGQVASQTLENIAVVDSVASRPVFRPLIGMDKTEIIAQAEKTGTFPISILPDQDCCTLFVPKHPVTRSTEAEVAPLEAALDVEALVEMAVNAVEVRDFDE